MTYNRFWLLPVTVLLPWMWVTSDASDIFNGREVYEMHCQTCHGMDGQAFEPGVPDFSRGESLYSPDVELVRSLRDGDGHMPSYRGLLSDEELRDVIAYIRTLQR
ncbi:MAG: cytochrome c [Gammaproteobacteria bacterium]|jgi:mono/diheme cytochrome c family protein|nr:cytochrome c [Gammaproteobacteria bacterium]MDH3758012.1 cytochrome c [Gammaproteobacteria bacterium]MDH3846322.1 cytochrome c [Gammaproteobacteria bacterium]MDH3864446.1 cytochrome c [Gammaproteobacteria bacterium]MDH3904745.1 cytochrome c [Gammaproteobacteria bacterium]